MEWFVGQLGNRACEHPVVVLVVVTVIWLCQTINKRRIARQHHCPMCIRGGRHGNG